MSKMKKFIPIESMTLENTEREVRALRDAFDTEIFKDLDSIRAIKTTGITHPEIKRETRKAVTNNAVAVYADISCKASDHSKNYCIVVVDNDARDQRCTFSGCDMSSPNISKKLSLNELKELAEIINSYIERESR